MNDLSDLSHTVGIKELRQRRYTAAAVRDDVLDEDGEIALNLDVSQFKEVVALEDAIATYQKVYVKSMTDRLGIDGQFLPSAYSIATLLNPLFGLKPLIVESELMSASQYDYARKALMKRIHDYYDHTNPMLFDNDDESSTDSLDGDVPKIENENYRKAVSELTSYEQYKRNKYHPTMDEDGSLGVGKFTLYRGKVTKRGKDLPSGKNLADYIDGQGRLDVLRFTGDHRSFFSAIAAIAQCEASRQTEEVGCERFFGLSGYVSSSRRSRLGVSNYERIALLADILQKIYIDPRDIAHEYLNRCKAGAWKKENTVESLRCFNLERVIDADAFNQHLPKPLPMQDYLNAYDDNDCVSSEDSDSE